MHNILLFPYGLIWNRSILQVPAPPLAEQQVTKPKAPELQLVAVPGLSEGREGEEETMKSIDRKCIHTAFTVVFV